METCNFNNFYFSYYRIRIGLWTSRLLNIDVITTILGAAPGGISGMSLVGSEYGRSCSRNPTRSQVDYCAYNSSSSCKMLELIWSNKILNIYRHISNKRYF